MAKRLWSAFTDDMDHCYFTGKKPVERHHIFGGPYRNISEKFGYVLPLSPELHPNGACAGNDAKSIDECLKIMAQRHFESNYGSRADFIEIFGKSHL